MTGESSNKITPVGFVNPVSNHPSWTDGNIQIPKSPELAQVFSPQPQPGNKQNNIDQNASPPTSERLSLVTKSFIGATMPQVLASSAFLSLIWTAAYLFFVAILTIQAFMTFKDYYSHPVNVEVTIETTSNFLDFPAVTFCNNNIVKKSSISRMPRYKELAFLSDVVYQNVLPEENTDNSELFTLGLFRCGIDYSQWIPESWVCNGRLDCSDAADEEPYRCSEHQGFNYSANCFEEFLECPDELTCAVKCDGIHDCVVWPGYDESEDIGCVSSTGTSELRAETTSKELMSPNFPNEYMNNLLKTYTISAPKDHVIKITINYFAVEEAVECYYDALEIIDVTADGLENHFRYNGYPMLCGYLCNFKDIITSSNMSKIYFHTDGIVTDYGWSLSYQAIPAGEVDLQEHTNKIEASYCEGSKLPPGGDFQYPLGGSDFQYPFDGSDFQYPFDGSDSQYPLDGSDLQYQLDGSDFQYPFDGSDFQYPFDGSDFQYPLDGSDSQYPLYGSDYPYPLYGGFFEYQEYWEQFWENFYSEVGTYEFSQFKDIQRYDWYSVYNSSAMPDYSDFKKFIKFKQEELVGNGHQKDDFIAQCVFDGQICDTSWFRKFQHVSFGNCFSFNSVVDAQGMNGNLGESIVTSKTGSENGLALSLFLENEEYLGIIGHNSGVRLVLHNSDEYPPLLTKGFEINAGTATTITIRQQTVHRESDPFSDCAEDWPQFLELNANYKKYRYTLEFCKYLCKQKTLAEVCGCTDTFDWNFSDNDVIRKAAKQDCDVWNSTEYACLISVYDDFDRGKRSCGCPNSCSDKIYRAFSSSASWPSSAYTAHFISLMKKSNSSKVKKFINNVLSEAYSDEYAKTKLQNDIKDNFARVTINFETMMFQKIKETPKYSLSILFGTIGGNLGLWLGWSILSVMEFLQWIAMTIGLFVMGRRKRVNNHNADANFGQGQSNNPYL